MSVTALPDLNLLPAEALKALVLAQHEQLLLRESEIAHLKLPIAKLQRMQFGRKSEKLTQQIEQLELRLEELQSKPAENPFQLQEQLPSATSSLASPAKPARRALPDHLPRQMQRHEPKESACPDCGGKLRKLGEDISEMLEYVPASFFVVRHVRPKLSCTKCDRIVQAPAPHSGSGVLGARAAQVLRLTTGARFAGGERTAGPNRSPVRDRERDSRPAGGTTP